MGGREEASVQEAEAAGVTEGRESMTRFAAAGILLGAGGPTLDPRRRALIHHSSGSGAGLFLGVDEDGYLFASDFSQESRLLARNAASLPETGDLELTVRVTPEGGEVRVILAATSSGHTAGAVSLDTGLLPRTRLAGGMALVSHGPAPGDPLAWFRRMELEGGGWEVVPDGALGPILGALHTVSRSRMRLTAQLFPVWGPLEGSSTSPPDSVLLEVQDEAGVWVPGWRAPVTAPGYTATFEVDG